MRTVRSIRGDWMRIIARHAFPRKTPRGRIEALADALEISRRSCYAYVAEERRVPEEIEQRFIGLFGAVAEDGWRTIEMLRPHTNKAKKKRDTKPRGMSKERYQIKVCRADKPERCVIVLVADYCGRCHQDLKRKWTNRSRSIDLSPHAFAALRDLHLGVVRVIITEWDDTRP